MAPISDDMKSENQTGSCHGQPPRNHFYFKECIQVLRRFASDDQQFLSPEMGLLNLNPLRTHMARGSQAA